MHFFTFFFQRKEAKSAFFSFVRTFFLCSRFFQMQGWGALLGPEAPGDYYDGVVRKGRAGRSATFSIEDDDDDADACPIRLPLLPASPASSPLRPNEAAISLLALSSRLFSPKAKELNSREPPEDECTSETETENENSTSDLPRFSSLLTLRTFSLLPTPPLSHRPRSTSRPTTSGTSSSRTSPRTS